MTAIPQMYFGMSVDDVALRYWSSPANFSRLIEFFAAERINATFFVVPIDEETDRPFYEVFPEYRPIIRSAHTAGHVFAQHGLRHNRFEFGVPPAMVLDLPHETENKKYAVAHRAQLEREQTAENLAPRLRQGRKILEDALEFPITGFRAPALQESPGMFDALAQEKYTFDSSACLQETGWDYLLGHTEVPARSIDRARWLTLRQKSTVPILPLTTDYTWYLTEARYRPTMELAKHDYRACVAANIPFVPVCHVNPVWDGDPGCGVRFLSELYSFAREDAAVNGYELRFETLEQIAGKV